MCLCKPLQLRPHSLNGVELWIEIEIMIVIHRIQFAAAAALIKGESLSQCSVELKKREVFKNVIIKY